MTKKVLLTVLMAAVLALTGCGVSPSVIDDLEYLEQLDRERAAASASASEANSVVSEVSEEPAEVPDVAQTSKFTVIELEPDKEYTVEGKFTVKMDFVDILSDKFKADGWTYYYSEGTQKDTAAIEWVPKNEAYTTFEIYLDYTNLMDAMEIPPTESMQGIWVYNAPMSEDSYSIDEISSEQLAVSITANFPEANAGVFTLLQENPGQMGNNGEQARSVDGVLLDKDVKLRVSLLGDIPEDVYRSWENKDGKPLWAVFALDDTTLFFVDLSKHMIDE